MKKIIYTLVGTALLVGACKDSDKKTLNNKADIATNFSIEILDEKALEVIDPKSEIEVLASGFEWTEGPLWIQQGPYLLFSDIPRNKIYKLDANKDTTTYLHPSGFSGKDFKGDEPGSNGLLLNKQGELILMQHGNRQIAKMNAPLDAPTPDFKALVSSYKGKRFNSPNDGVLDKLGNLYFTDPPYGLPGKMDDPNKELSFQGIYCLLTSGELVVLDSLSRPNGIGLSPDGSKLYVANSDPAQAAWYQYNIIEPGKLSQRELFLDVTQLIGKKGQQGLPDGLKVNRQGILFASGPGGIWIIDPSGKPLARIHTGQATANCAFNNDEKKLFMTADNYILSVDLK